jgi:hypothetical protein
MRKRLRFARRFYLIRLPVYVLSKLFPPRFDRLTNDQIRESLDFRHRDSRHAAGIVFSSAGAVKEHPGQRVLTPKERRRREISNTAVLTVGDRVFIERIR